MNIKKIWQVVREWVAAAPLFLRSIARTPTGKYLITAFLMQVVRRTPWMQAVPDDGWKEMVSYVLDGGTAMTLAAGTLYANDKLADLKALMRPNRVEIDQNSEYARFINTIVNPDTQKLERVTAYEIRDGVMYAVAENGLVPVTRESEMLQAVRKAILEQMRGQK